jgi:hypothetical protein
MSTVICHYNMQINQSHHLDHFPICQKANGVSKESTFVDNMVRLQEIAQAVIKLVSQKW